MLHEREGVDDIDDRLGHLLPAVEQEAVGEDASRKGDAGRHEEGGPVDGVEAQDVLANHMDIAGQNRHFSAFSSG